MSSCVWECVGRLYMEGRIFGHTVTENSLTRLSGSLNFCPLRSRCCSRALKKSLTYKAEEILRREEEGGGKIGGSRWNVESQLSSRARAAAPCPAGRMPLCNFFAFRCHACFMRALRDGRKGFQQTVHFQLDGKRGTEMCNI